MVWYQNVSRSWGDGYEWSGTRTYPGHGGGGGYEWSGTRTYPGHGGGVDMSGLHGTRTYPGNGRVDMSGLVPELIQVMGGWI